MKTKLYYIRLFFAFLFFVLTVLAVMGVFYPVKILNIQFLPIIQRMFVDFSFLIILLFLFVVFLTLFYGRLYCSVLCPLGFIQEVLNLFINGEKKTFSNNFCKYIFAAILIGTMLGGSTILIRYFEPFTIFSSAFSLSLAGIVSVILIVFLNFVRKRFFCRNLCPVGAILGFISKFSLNKLMIDSSKCVSCRVCEKNCDFGCIDIDKYQIDNENCNKCLKCMSLCPNGAICYKSEKETKKINFKRRTTILSIAVIAIFSVAVKFGNYAKQYVKDIKNIVLPPGTKNKTDFINKCFNCDLCVNNCPTKILTKANENFGAVHIDYAKGKGFCEYECVNCSQVCPTCAIKKISKEEKQKIRIAVASIDVDKCMNCGLCRNDCPTSAIYSNENGKSVVDISKCIGCGKCKVNCNYHAVNILAVDEQVII